MADEPSLMAELMELRKENSALKELLKASGIHYEAKQEEIKKSAMDSEVHAGTSNTVTIHAEEPLSVTAKIQLFKSLFHGREDVYAKRWESRSGRTGYSPCCFHEWDPLYCKKRDVRCDKCPNRDLKPLSDSAIENHLMGEITIGVYALLPNEHCHFLAVDFDESAWKENIAAFRETCDTKHVPVSIEISRSGNGAHAWIFFSEPVLASKARELGMALISQTCARTGQLSLKSYDRLFPNQDSMPKGGFGNLIALPLQKHRRKLGCTVFVDNDFVPYKKQWHHLATIEKLSPEDVELLVKELCAESSAIDVGFLEDCGEDKPWEPANPKIINEPKPKCLNIVLAQQIFIEKQSLTPTAKNRIIRLASFGNPEFHRRQALRLSVGKTPRVICCAEEFDKYIALPRGRYNDLQKLLAINGITANVEDKRSVGTPIHISFKGDLRPDQKKAMKRILENEYGILWATTGFGKTVVAAAVIAHRAVPALILVHTKELAKQWRQRIKEFIDGADIGDYIAGKNKLSGCIDIALVQSLEHAENLKELLMPYGQVVIDECHHCAAFKYEQVLKQINAKFVLGLTATPVRKEGNQEIAYMQCGSICHRAVHLSGLQLDKKVFVHDFPDVYSADTIQEKFRLLTNNENRNKQILEDVVEAYGNNRNILVLSDRVDHLTTLYNSLRTKVNNCYLLHGKMKSRERNQIVDSLKSSTNPKRQVIFATGRLIGEGFDHPRLDTLVVAMPFSWKGTLEQYVGRLSRDFPGKDSIWVFDYVEPMDAQLNRMWQKRSKGFKRLSYRISFRNKVETDSNIPNQKSLPLESLK